MRKLRVEFLFLRPHFVSRGEPFQNLRMARRSEIIMRNLLVAFLLFACAAQAAGVPSDSELARRVKSTLGASVGAPARGIEIVVLDRVVSLYGRVPSLAVRDAAVSAAERTPGVRGVTSNLDVGASR